MPSVNVLDADRDEMYKRLREAVDNWNPHRPRRWLAKYGGWRVEKRSALAQRYCALRNEAKIMLSLN